MSKILFRLIGHGNPLGSYPAPVVPVGRIGDSLVAIYVGDNAPEIVTLDEKCSFTEHGEELSDSLAAFDFEFERLFALSEKNVLRYSSESERKFFLSLLSDPQFSESNLFLRLSLAKATKDATVIAEEVEKCSTVVSGITPNFLDIWLRGQHQGIAQLPSKSEIGAAGSSLSPTFVDKQYAASDLSSGFLIDKIESTPGSPNPYQLTVRIPDHGQLSGLLTREILTGLDTRSVLLLSEESVADFLPRAEAEALNELREIANGLDINRLGRVGVHKEIVIGLFTRQHHYPMQCVLVHRFGPVPGILIKTTARSPIDPDTPLYLGVYLSLREKRHVTKKGGFLSIDLLHSLQYFPEVLFQRYFEDVGAIFDSIAGRADLSRTLWWAKSIETIIAESVNSKLIEIFPNSKRSGLKEELARRRREEHPYQFLRAAYARYVCLYLLNQLYECLGIWGSGKYRDRLLSFRLEYQRFFPKEVLSGAFRTDPVLSDLERIFNALEDGLKGERSDQFRVDLGSRQKWVTQVCEFARFVWLLRTHGTPLNVDASRAYDPTIANVFISAHHAVPVANAVREELSTKTNDGKDFQPEVQLLYVREGAGTPFLEAIKGRIWLSDGLLAVIPTSTQKLDVTSADYYKWIGEEALAALSLNKELLFVAQPHPQGSADVSRLIDEVQSSKGVISGATNLEDLKRDLVDRLRNMTNYTFLVSEEGSIDEPLVDAFKVFSRKAHSNRTNQLVRGFLRQLSDSVFNRLRGLRQVGVGTPEEIMAHLTKSSKHPRLRRIAFKDLYDKARERRLIINDVPQYLMVAAKQNKRRSTQRATVRYAWNLTEILRKLRPYATEEEIQIWEESLMDWADREAARGDSSFRAA